MSHNDNGDERSESLFAEIDGKHFLMKCAYCGKLGGSPKKCTSCKQARYCNRKCQRAHWGGHKIYCKARSNFLKSQSPQARVQQEQALLEQLQSSPPRESCPICMLPMPLSRVFWAYMECCGKYLCRGCELKRATVVYFSQPSGGDASSLGEIYESLECCFCRTPRPKTDEELVQRLKHRVTLKDHQAMLDYSEHLSRSVPPKDAETFEMLLEASELGSPEAPGVLASFYEEGRGGVAKCRKKFRETLQLGALRGSVVSQNDLANEELRRGNYETALFWWETAAKAGDYWAMTSFEEEYGKGFVSREAYSDTVHEYREAMTSEERERFDAGMSEAGMRTLLPESFPESFP